MDHTQILLRPVVTEKATFLRDGANQVASSSLPPRRQQD